MAPWSTLGWIRDQRATLPEVVNKDLSDKTIVVIGANIGLGLEASRHFARMKPEKLILACRDTKKGDAAAKDIKETTGYDAEVSYIDLADFSSITAFVQKLNDNGKGKVDLALLNAGVNLAQYQLSKDGWESNLQINHLGTSLLALLLLPILSRAKTTDSFPRLTIVASEVHFFIDPKKKFPEVEKENILDALNDTSTPTMSTRYFVTKLFNVFFTRALAERLPAGTPLDVDVVNPGLTESQMTERIIASSHWTIRWLVSLIVGAIARPTEKGSRTLVHASLEGSNKDIQGKYLNKCQIDEESDLVSSKEGKVLQDRLWTETLDALIKVHPQL